MELKLRYNLLFRLNNFELIFKLQKLNASKFNLKAQQFLYNSNYIGVRLESVKLNIKI